MDKSEQVFTRGGTNKSVAEGVGFEPTNRFKGGLSISSRVPSTTQPPLRNFAVQSLPGVTTASLP